MQGCITRNQLNYGHLDALLTHPKDRKPARNKQADTANVPSASGEQSGKPYTEESDALWLKVFQAIFTALLKYPEAHEAADRAAKGLLPV